MVADRFKREKIAGHVVLSKGERSELAELAANLLLITRPTPRSAAGAGVDGDAAGGEDAINPGVGGEGRPRRGGARGV